ncbi:MAG: TadE family protein [Bacillota bacterium]|nr:MAG: TadE family protein [Bacillota bacterium]
MELALVLPILLLILMAIIDMGRIYHGYLSVTTAAREGARQASLGRTDEEIRATAILSATPLKADHITVVISPDARLRYSGANIEVKVEYQMAIITPGMQAFFPNPYVVIGKAVMKRE